MTITVLRTAQGWWVQTGGGAARVNTTATSTSEILADRTAIEVAALEVDTKPVEHLDLLSPVTAPCRVVAQMTNFASHARDVGLDPGAVPLAFFRKTSGSICGPHDAIIKPAHVKFLDYEVEIALVIGRAVPVGTTVTATNWSEFVAGLVITNDVSARDVQLTKTQFYESKSYPSFTPVGPALVLLDSDELKRFGDLRLTLSVNGQLRQSMLVGADIIYRPAQALAALSRFQSLDAGDIVLTGTPVGTALSAPAKSIQTALNVLPAAAKWKLFFASQAKNTKYLQDGDVVEVRAGTDDGVIDLGEQRSVVRYAP